MRKLALVAAVAIAAAFSAQSNVAVAQGGKDLNPNTTKLMQAAINPGGASAATKAPGKMAKKGGKKKKMAKKGGGKKKK